MRKNRNSEPYVVRKKNILLWHKFFIGLCIFSLIIIVSLGGYFASLLNLLLVIALISFIFSMPMYFKSYFEKHENRIDFCVNEKGLYLYPDYMEHPKKIPWDLIEEIRMNKLLEMKIMEIKLITGETFQFYYGSLFLNLYRFRRAVRYFSGRDDLLKTNGPLWMNM